MQRLSALTVGWRGKVEGGGCDGAQQHGDVAACLLFRAAHKSDSHNEPRAIHMSLIHTHTHVRSPSFFFLIKIITYEFTTWLLNPLSLDPCNVSRHSESFLSFLTGAVTSLVHVAE